ncbi:PX domain-containing protein kinase-like protein isoform X5 [Carassius carassius]|uniref:PX domain-containing protein kinase-like protein isoform X5 n=1 Tax=Carassius carassius TaxID=217509 RepID=UPI0028685F64|nr:PX domain-containing protein kinase-like protein isoform X5 [Carassius carassius]
MAFMEQQPQPMIGRKPPLDDTVPLTAVIEASQSLQSHTEYIIRVQRGVSTDNSWTVIRRYSDFDMLNNSLLISGLNLPLPPKKLLGNMDREFIAERQKGLQAYLNYITRHHILSSCELVKKFLDTNNYSANYTEIALQQVSMFFRSDPKWEVIEPLKDIGWRLKKRYFLIKDKDQPKDKQVLSWVDLGPDKFLSDKDLLSAMKLLPTLSHSNISPVTFATTSESSALVIRVFSEKGTLRDHICKVKSKEPFLKKYCNPKKIQGLEQQQIQTYGRQILEALKFLHDKGFPYGHLHASNVLIEEDTCKLLDIENSLLGLPSYYRPYVTQFRKINTTESIDVYSFGHLLYEMTYGRPPDAVPVDQYPPPPSSSVDSVLQSILSTEACKTGMPTISQLLQTPLFSSTLLFNSEKPQFKISSKLKEALKSSKECLEKRLVEEQRTIHQHKRLTRAQSHHGSEEEKRKRKILARKKSRQSTYENEEDLSVKYNNNSAGSGASSPPTCPSSPTPLPGSEHAPF